MFNKLVLVYLAVLALLLGIAHVTNIQIVWMDPKWELLRWCLV